MHQTIGSLQQEETTKLAQESQLLLSRQYHIKKGMLLNKAQVKRVSFTLQ